MNRQTSGKTISPIAIISTLAVTAGLVWAIVQLLGPAARQREFTAAGMKRHEIITFENLRAIAAAQSAYRKKDWDRDGEEEFAMFYVHLYSSVAPDSEPVPVNLIPKRLAFAMGISRMLDGYYYKDMRQQETASGARELLDYTRQWGVLAMPASKGRTGVLSFIACHDGAIYVTPRMYTELAIPFDPARNGWARIDSQAELERFQLHVDYSSEL